MVGGYHGWFEFDMTDENHFRGWLGASMLEVENNKSNKPSGELLGIR
jgi:hypothetical protein